MNEQKYRLPPLPQLAGEICKITGDAARQILEIYNSEFTIKHKDDHSPLTAADTAAHDAICKGLQDLTPDIPVLSEESANIPFSTRKNWRYFWLVDPLDGTREFIKRNGEFTINIALIEEHAPILGVVHVPVTGQIYFASRGNGAFRKPGNDGPVRIRTRSINPRHIAVAGSRSHGSAKQQAFFSKLGDVEIHAIGSALKFCLVAEGTVDIYPRFGPTSEWDTAAAQCIVEEAGGIVTGINFEPLRYNCQESLLNPDFLAIADKSFDWQPYLSD
ncbi:MAG: 3'(2'),5'-bisphosphate nucleotidase CysQ [Gammaproteobacteria bacterium]